MLGSTIVGGEWTSAPPPPLLTPAAYDGVAALADAGDARCNEHDRASRRRLLDGIADYLGIAHLPPSPATARVLLVPGDTVDLSADGYAGVAGCDVLGGVVPAMFVGSKAIAHGLVDPDAARPAEWSTDMAALMGDAALPGYTAFTVQDAARAGRTLLARGPVRIKDVCGKAGLGQQVVRDAAALDAALAAEDPTAMARCGIVLEENLTDVLTYSVGTVALGGESIAYWAART